MDAMKQALLKVGAVTEDDVKRVKEETEAQEAAEWALQKMEREVENRLKVAFRWFPPRVVSEINKFMDDNGAILPLELLEKWGEEVGVPSVKNTVDNCHRTANRVWAMFLNQWKERKDAHLRIPADVEGEINGHDG